MSGPGTKRIPTKDRLGRMPTHMGAVWIVVLGLFLGVLVAQIAVRVIGIEGAFALLVELAVLGLFVAGVWAALPDRFFTRWNGFHAGERVETWVDPKDRDDGRPKPFDPDETRDPHDPR